jgi:acyl-coenzyme A synthetase/AMP-(fatty) acid ligase
MPSFGEWSGGRGAAAATPRSTKQAVRLPASSVPADFQGAARVAFHDELPREDTGKIFKRRLREALLGRPGARI